MRFVQRFYDSLLNWCTKTMYLNPQLLKARKKRERGRRCGPFRVLKFFPRASIPVQKLKKPNGCLLLTYHSPSCSSQ